MADFTKMTKDELVSLKAQLQEKYDEYKSMELSLNMSRGKPCKEQLDMSEAMLDVVNADSGLNDSTGLDCRNYGLLEGIPECRELFGEILGVPADNILVGGNSSLQLMFDYVTQCYIGNAGKAGWSSQEKTPKFLCPCPGYDRHFGICEYYGIEMINIRMTENGPDMEQVREYIKDDSVKGMFCVPKYSNPQGYTYSDEVVREIAALKPAADDFRIIWDNAYIIHDLSDTPDTLLNIFPELEKNGNEDMVVEFASTSKITFPGSGVAVIAGSDSNIKSIKERWAAQIISYDKLNQLRHIKYLGNAQGMIDYMQKHKEIIKPKFDLVINSFREQLGDKGIAYWTEPKGGYFISLDVMHGTASRVGELCKQAGVTLTSVGATYPYGKDPDDTNIRVAPTFPSMEELEKCCDILCLSVQLAAAEKLLEA